MSQNTKLEVLAKLRQTYARAGTVYKRQLLDHAAALFGYHRKADRRALRAGPPLRNLDVILAAVVLGLGLLAYLVVLVRRDSGDGAS